VECGFEAALTLAIGTSARLHQRVADGSRAGAACEPTKDELTKDKNIVSEKFDGR
jgi:hypothetical protein